jgi:hypothetical protein
MSLTQYNCYSGGSRKKSHKGMIMLKMMPGSVKAASQSLLFRCNDGPQEIACSILAHALDDLFRFHGLDVKDDQAIDQLLGQIERIVNDKVGAGRLEPNGEIVIRGIDILRYGSNPFGQGQANGENHSR